MRADIKNGAFEARRQGEIIRIEAWGPTPCACARLV